MYHSWLLDPDIHPIETIKKAAINTLLLSSETISFSVNGTDACKATIETLITNVEGVISETWESSTKIITIVYNPDTVDKTLFYVTLAESGYDKKNYVRKIFDTKNYRRLVNI